MKLNDPIRIMSNKPLNILNNDSTNIELAKSLIKEFEGLRLTAYFCPAGKKTIGYGHVLQGDEKHLWEITENKAEELLDKDIIKAKSVIDEYCTSTLTHRQEAALISFIFNCGIGAFTKSTLLKKLNEEDYKGAANEFNRWINVGGVKLKGLVRRRLTERNLFLNR